MNGKSIKALRKSAKLYKLGIKKCNITINYGEGYSLKKQDYYSIATLSITFGKFYYLSIANNNKELIKHYWFSIKCFIINFVPIVETIISSGSLKNYYKVMDKYYHKELSKLSNKIKLAKEKLKNEMEWEQIKKMMDQYIAITEYLVSNIKV